MNYWTQPIMKGRLDLKDQTKAATNIINKVADFYGIKSDEVIGRCRKQEFVKARFLAIYFIKNRTDFTLKRIGEIFGRDHASIIHALKTIKQVQSLHYETDVIRDLKKLSNII